ncbi:MAG: hypothetical protein ACTHJY_03205 [Rhizobiaceae bacterium]
MATISALVLMMAPAAAAITDFLGVPGPILFDGKSYELAWTARP